MTTPVTGDSKDYVAKKPQTVTLHKMSTVSAADLADIDAVINDYSQSGKRFGALITVNVSDVPTLYQAAGSAPADKWYKVSDLAVSVTPA